MPFERRFYYVRSARLRAYVAISVTAVLAVGLTDRAFAATAGLDQPTEHALPALGLWIATAVLGWGLLIILATGLVRRIGAFRAREPAITVGDEGICLPAAFGKPLRLMWSDVAEMRLRRRGDRCTAVIRRGGGLVVVPLADLDVDPMGVWDALSRSRQAFLATFE